MLRGCLRDKVTVSSRSWWLQSRSLGLCRWDWERGQEVGPDGSPVSCRLQCCYVLEHPALPVSEQRKSRGLSPTVPNLGRQPCLRVGFHPHRPVPCVHPEQGMGTEV